MTDNPSWLDRAIAAVAPHWGLKRAQARTLLRLYEAAQPSRYRKQRADNASGDATTRRAGAPLRALARHLDQNHDLACGLLTTLCDRIVGPTGIAVEPQPRTRDGAIHDELAKAQAAVWEAWGRQPETTKEHSWASAEWLLCLAWLRDGEALLQVLEGAVPFLEHGSRVPLSLELLEADYLADLDDERLGITQGVERDAWGKPRAFHLYKTHPGDYGWRLDTKRVPAERIIHVKSVRRFRQARGVTILAAVLNRLDDLKDYEESERVAARVAAAMAGFVRKGTPDMYMPPEPGTNGELAPRDFKLQPGLIFDTLAPGEEVGAIDVKRPSGLLEPFRNAMLKAIAAGTGSNYSTVARDYSGTYSSQRQSLVEADISYRSLTDDFKDQCTQPIYERVQRMAVLAGLYRLPRDIDPETVFSADYRGPPMPWISPDDEAKANEMLVKGGFRSRAQIIRERGESPADVLAQIERERQEADAKQLIFTTDPKHKLQEKG